MRPIRVLVPVLAAMTLLPACGRSSDTAAPAPSTIATVPNTSAPAPSSTAASMVKPAPTSPLPRMQVHRLPDGELTPLDALLPSDKPLLVWFWAPH